MEDGQDWGEAYKELCAIIKNDKDPSKGVEEILHIDLWHEQTNYLADEYPFPANSVFLDFKAVNIDTSGLQVQDIEFDVTVYYVVDTLAETYQGSTTQDLSLDFIRVCKKLHRLLQGTSGANFGQMNRNGMASERAPEYLIVYKQVYRTIVRDSTAMKQRGTAKLAGATVRAGNKPLSNDEKLFKIDL